MRGNTKSKMLLLELMFSVLIFSFCVIVCAGVFYQASVTANKSRDLSFAAFTAQIAAESFNATNDVNELATLLSGKTGNGLCHVWFDKEWQTCAEEDARAYMSVDISRDGLMSIADITITLADGAPVYRLTAAKYTPHGE